MFLSVMMLTGACMVSCSDKDEEELIFGNETVEIDFNKDGEPEFNPSLAIDESFLNQHLGHVAAISYVRYIRQDGTIDASSTVPNKLYGILNPNLYLKDKNTLIIFRQEDGAVTQYVKKHITIDMENSVIRSEGKYVAQLGTTIASSGWSQGLFYYGKQEGENQYVYVHIEGWRNVNLPNGLDEL